MHMTSQAFRHIARTGIILLLALLIVSLASAQSAAQPRATFANDRVLVAFQPGTAASDIAAAHRQAHGKVIKTLEGIGVQVVAVPVGRVLTALGQYQKNPNVKFAEPSYKRPIYLPKTSEGDLSTIGVPNAYTEQWGLHNTGQSFGAVVDPLTFEVISGVYSGVAGADIDAEGGWALSQGSAGVKIAIIDTGISCVHADLQGKCVEQVNFVDYRNSPDEDIVGHGTHVAGIAAAITNNNVGIAGVAREASIGSLKVCYEDTSLALYGIIQAYCEDADIAAAIMHAADHGYQVINMSLAGPQFSQTLQDAVDYAWAHNVVIVAGAGNDYTTTRLYPAAFTNVIAVAATDYYDNLAYFSTFSTDSDDWVSVAAPGHVIFSTVPGSFCGIPADDPGGCYDWKSGTSMATPFVAGMAAELWNNLTTPTNTAIRDLIESTADAQGPLGQNLLAWTRYGRVNLQRAVQAALDSSGGGGGGGNGDTTAPVISNVSVQNKGPNFTISWTTDEAATSVVSFTDYGDFSDTTMVTSHSMDFHGSKNRLYTYTVSSTDAAGNTATAGPFNYQN